MPTKFCSIGALYLRRSEETSKGHLSSTARPDTTAKVVGLQDLRTKKNLIITLPHDTVTRAYGSNPF